MADMNIPLFLLFAAFGVIYIFMFSKNMKKTVGRRTTAMKKLATELGLTTQGGGPMFAQIRWLRWIKKPLFILDSWHGKELSIYHFSKGSGKNKTSYAALDVPLDKTPDPKDEFKMSISAVGWMSHIGVALGRKPMETGDETFDKQFIIKSNRPEIATAILLPELRTKLTAIWDENAAKGVINIHEGRVHYEESGYIRTDAHVRRFCAIAALCHELANTVDAARSL